MDACNHRIPNISPVLKHLTLQLSLSSSIYPFERFFLVKFYAMTICTNRMGGPKHLAGSNLSSL